MCSRKHPEYSCAAVVFGRARQASQGMNGPIIDGLLQLAEVCLAPGVTLHVFSHI